MAQNYKPPINFMVIISGLGGVLTSLWGGHNANIAGPMTAICSSEEAGEDKETRYASAVICGVFFCLFGIFASIAVGIVSGLPSTFVAIVAGLAMIGILTGSFYDAFSCKRYNTGVFFALIIAMSNITLFKISAPFWALLGGVVVSYIMEPEDFTCGDD